MASHTTIASGVLSVGCLAAAVKFHMDCKRAIDQGDEPPKSKKRMKKVFMVATVLLAGFFAYQMMGKTNASSSFIPTSSMSHNESEAEFARRVSEATKKLRQQIQEKKHHTPLMSSSRPRELSSSELAARASAEISSFIANSM